LSEPAAVDAATLLSRPAAEGARRLALAFLDQAVAAFPRLNDPGDSEALHDFRVALRRLRSCLRAYEKDLAGSVPKKLARRLRRLADATGPGRDAEVQVAWLRGLAKHLHPAHRPGLAWQLGRLEATMAGAYSALRAEVAGGFPALERELRRHLSVYRIEVRLEGGGDQRTLAEATAEILLRQLADLREHLARIENAGDEKNAHRARISAKRMRYLLEPVVGETPGGTPASAAPLVKRLKKLQDLLGELHDAHVLERDLAAAAEAAAVERARRLVTLAPEQPAGSALLRSIRRRPHESGILALARLNRERRDRLFAELDEEWLGGRADTFLQKVDALAAELRHAGGSSEPPA
jgi:CHAD domain-containing protein